MLQSPKILLLLASAVLIFSAVTAWAQNLPVFIFLNDLKIGDSNSDVGKLQKILNSDPETIVSTVGVGSPGNESTYFGPATEQGVIRFQKKYANEVLRPAGLTQATGFVGLWTRLKLNQILLKTSVGQTPPVPMFSNGSGGSSRPVTVATPGKLSVPKSPNGSSEFILAFPSTYSGPAGSELSISGSGFSAVSNTVFFKQGSKIYKVENIPAKKADEISFKVPDVPVGRYDITVSNGTKKDPGSVSFVVTAVGAVAPVVESVQPAQAKFGEKVTIVGQNFTPTGNIVSSNLGVINDLKSSDGKTLTFSLGMPNYLDDDDEQLKQFWLNKKIDLQWTVYVRVINTNGVSANTESAKFEMTI